MNTFNILKEGKKEFCDLNNDYILPEYISDVYKIGESDVNYVITNTYVNGSAVTVDGEVTYNILLICDDDHIHNTIYTEDFSISYTASSENDNIHHKCIIESHTCRLISPRKINCKAKISLLSKERCELSSESQLLCDDIALARATVEYRYTDCDCMNITDKSVTMQHASQDVELPSNKEEIENIVYCRLSTIITEQKHIDNKLYIKGDTFLDFLYESVNSAYVNIKHKFPFSDIVDDIDAAQGYMCEVIIRDIKAVAKNNSFGEMRLLELDYSYDINCSGYLNQKYRLADDLYSTEYDSDCNYAVTPIFCLNNIFSGNISIDDTLNCKDITEQEFDQIITCNAAPSNCEVKVVGEHINISGVIRFDVIAKGEKLYHFSHTKPFRYERECGGEIGEIYEEHKIYTAQCNAQIDNGKLILSTELYFNVMLSDLYECKFIESAKLTPMDNADKMPMILYYPKKDERLWDVAKKFKCTCDDIIKVNDLKNESLNDVKVLLLPRKKQKSVFSRII